MHHGSPHLTLHSPPPSRIKLAVARAAGTHVHVRVRCIGHASNYGRAAAPVRLARRATRHILRRIAPPCGSAASCTAVRNPCDAAGILSNIDWRPAAPDEAAALSTTSPSRRSAPARAGCSGSGAPAPRAPSIARFDFMMGAPATQPPREARRSKRRGHEAPTKGSGGSKAELAYAPPMPGEEESKGCARFVARLEPVESASSS